MDQGLAVKPELAALTAGGGKPLGVGEIEMDAVEHRPSMRARCQQHKAERGEERQPVACRAGMQIVREIRGTQDQRADTRARRGNVRRGQNTERRLDHAPDRKLGRRAQRVEQLEREPHPLGIFHFGQ